MNANHHIIQSLGLLVRNRAALRPISLSVLLLGLFWPGLAGAADLFVSLHDGSWFDAPNTWGQSSSPGFGDNVEITKVVAFDSSTSGQSVTVSNLNLYNGTLNVSGPATLGMAGTNSYWNNGTLGGSLLQLGGLALAGTNTIGDNYIGQLSNQGVVYHSGTAPLNIGWGSHFENQAEGTYRLEGDGSIVNVGVFYTYFSNSGRLRKSSGSGTSTIGVPFNNLDGSIQVDSGTLSLAAGGSSSSGTFIVASGAVLDLTGGSSPTWAGLVSGSGAGTVLLSGGTVNTSPSLTLNLPDGLFQWTGGWLSGTTINSNVVTIAGSGSAGLAGGFYNGGLVRHTNTATLDIGANNAHFDNQAGGTYDLEGDGGIVVGVYYTSFNNSGRLRKSGGSGTSTISGPFNNLNGTIEVDSSTLSLAGSGSSSNGTFTVAAGAVLDLTGGRSPTWAGQVNGSGAGQVLLSGGTVNTSPSFTLNLPNGLFQWTGGWLSGATINSNVVTIAGTNSVWLAGGFYNSGLVRHTDTATLDIGANNAHFDNQAGGTYDLEGDGGIVVGVYYTSFNNSGRLRKSGGSGTSTISGPFNNLNGTIEVDSGTLSLAGSGSSSNGTFTVAAGAVLDLTGGRSPTWTGQVNGSGAGQVLLSGGTVNTSPSFTLNLPNGLFQWTGGWLSGATINSNVVTIAGTNSVWLAGGFYNSGLVRQTSTATLHIGQNYAHFDNQAGGTYDLEGDGGIVVGVYYTSFNNYGLLRKSGGSGTSTVSGPFYNLDGSIEVDRGQLSLNGQTYAQGSGSFIVTLGGTNAAQSGQLVCGSATLAGPLKVTLASGFAPAPGNQLQILSCSSLAGAFSSINVPAGISVSYSNNGVYLVVTGTVPAQIVNPILAGNDFSFSIGTVSNQSYTVQRNDNLNTTNWVFYTNFTGNGSLMQVFAPVTSVSHRFFRVCQP